MFIEGTEKPPDEYINYLLCKEFGWTYQELMSQPASFIEGLLTTMNVVKKTQNWQKPKPLKK